MSLNGETVAMIASHEFEDIELEYTLLHLSHEGADVVLVPVNHQFALHPRPALEETGSKPVTGRYGTPCPPEVISDQHYRVVEFEDLSVDEIDCLLYPGGFSPDHLRTHDGVVEFTKQAYEANKIVAAICHGPWMLAEADVIDGRDVCAWQAVHTDLENAGATVHDVAALQDGNIVTGRCPDDLPEFSEAVAEALVERQDADTPAPEAE